MRKLWAIARKDVIMTFTDRNLILIMLVTPLVISTIIALAFGNITGGGAPLENVPVALVNLDEGDANGFNAGNIFLSAFGLDTASSSDNTFTSGTCETVAMATDGDPGPSLSDLTAATLLTDPAAARAGVDAGDYAAAIIIPAGYSAGMAYSEDNPELNPVPLEIYADSGRTIAPQIIRAIAESISNQILTGQITVAATISTLVERAQANTSFGLMFLGASSTGQFAPDFTCAFTPDFNTVRVVQQAVSGEQTGFNPLVMIGAAQAVFFALFTASGGASSVLEERKDGTLQRMIVSPTPRSIILGGKALGVLAMVLLQLVFLLLSLSLISGLLYGTFAIWGTDWVAIIALLLLTALAASGVGMLTAAIARTAESANIIGSIVALFMGVLGGAFFTLDAIPVLQPFTRLSIVRWGSEGFTKLAQGNSDIGLNLLFLGLIGAAMFAVGLFMFNRRQDI